MNTTSGRLSEAQAAVLRALGRHVLKRFRRGYAESKAGPFYADRTVTSLVRRDLVQLQRNCEIARLTNAGAKRLRLLDDRH